MKLLLGTVIEIMNFRQIFKNNYLEILDINPSPSLFDVSLDILYGIPDITPQLKRWIDEDIKTPTPLNLQYHLQKRKVFCVP